MTATRSGRLLEDMDELAKRIRPATGPVPFTAGVLMHDVGSPNKMLERALRQAIIRSLHLLLPELRTHVARCPACEEFHDWLTWKHVEGTTEWVATCPISSVKITLPFRFGSDSEAA